MTKLDNGVPDDTVGGNSLLQINIFDVEGKPRKQADILIDIGRSHALFHDPARNAYAGIERGTYLIDTTAYHEILAEKFFSLTGKGCNRNALKDAITTLSSLAKFKGDCRDVWLRVGGDRKRILIDVGTADYDLIEVTAGGWDWTSGGHMMFRRTPSMQTMPIPSTSNFSLLWNYLSVVEEHRPLVAAFLLASLCPVGPYPTLHLSGEQGTGKSTFARVIKRIIDPSVSPLRAAPRDLRDLLVGALNGWALSIDNLSTLNPQLSDALCRLSTGGAISERALYSNTDEILIEVQRPVILNGIEDLASRPDLAERGIHIELEQINGRRTETEFWATFEIDARCIFAALLDGLVYAISNFSNINIGKLPRMADFAMWAAGGMVPLAFTADQFMSAYRTNIAQGQTASIDSSPVGEAVMRLMISRESWTGTAQDLMGALRQITDESAIRNSAWPKNARWMSGNLARLAPALREKGIQVHRQRGESRLITLCRAASFASLASGGGSPHESKLERIFSRIGEINDLDANDAKNMHLHNMSPTIESNDTAMDEEAF